MSEALDVGWIITQKAECAILATYCYHRSRSWWAILTGQRAAWRREAEWWARHADRWDELMEDLKAGAAANGVEVLPFARPSR